MTEQRFDGVCDALENCPAEAAHMKSRSGLMIAIRAVDGWQLSQAEAASRLGVTQLRMNDLLRGRIDKLSLDALIILATEAGLTVAWRVSKPAARRSDNIRNRNRTTAYVIMATERLRF